MSAATRPGRNPTGPTATAPTPTATPAGRGVRGWPGRRRTGAPLSGPWLPEAGAVLVRAVGVEVVRGPRRTLVNVDLAVHAGEVVAVVGPNGAGKSTLVAVLAGDLTPAAGHVELDGRQIERWGSLETARRRSVLPQASTFAFPFPVHEVVAMGRAPWAGTPAAADDARRVAETMADTDVTDMADRSVATLSGGERARVALARVLAQDAALLVLDEPTAALDLHHQELVLARARAHADGRGGVVVVLHDLNLAASHADRIVLLDAGRVVADGPPAEVLRGELLSEVYHHPVDVVTHPRTGGPLVLPR